MNQGEFLYPLPSVMAFVSENLNVYRMEKDGTPNIDLQSTVGMLASNWVNVIDDDDDFLLSELIYWKNIGL
jgi:hypothetical protein